MERLNKKNSMVCHDWDRVEHNNELQDIEGALQRIVDYDCIVFKKYIDRCNRHREVEIFKHRIHRIADLYEMADAKYGVDICVDNEDFVNICVFGERYEDTEGVSGSLCVFKIIPVDHKGNIINVGRYLRKAGGILVSHEIFSEFQPH